MRSESWCKTASFIAAFLTVIAALLVFVTGVIEAVVYGQESPGLGAGMFFVVAIAGGIGVMLWWFVSQWCMPNRNNTNRPRSNSFRRFCTAETCQYVYYCLRSARATSSENLLL